MGFKLNDILTIYKSGNNLLPLTLHLLPQEILPTCHHKVSYPVALFMN
ncbi:MAG: hypothetical protein JWQ57_2871 [Mucilaginibacter sp.]|nr:hypothetical protein [Mucilaginibacter sp.]